MAPSLGHWQHAKVKRTGVSESLAGAVIVRPTRLAKPCSSMKRYQYSRSGSRSGDRKRHVQSESALIFAVPPAMIFLNSGVVEISTTNFLAILSFTGGRLVHKITLLAVGSPDATPCGKRSRRSMAFVGILFAQPFFVVMAKPINKDCKNFRRLKVIRFLFFNFDPEKKNKKTFHSNG